MYRLCPRDFEPLSPHEWESATYHVCGACHGVLLEASEVDRILRSGAHPPAKRPAGEPAFEDGSALCSCSGEAMTTVSRAGVRVDRCPSCKAIWFDAGELQRVVAARRKQRQDLGSDEGKPRRSEGLAVIDALGSILELLFVTLG